MSAYGFPQRLKRAMRDGRVTQEELARRLGVSRSLVGHWGSGQRTPDAETIRGIAAALQVDNRWLEGGPPMTAPQTATVWDFPGPIPGQRDFGNANVWTVPADVKTEVREAGQNIEDAADGKSRSTVMRFRVIELTGQEVTDFKDAAGWVDLEKHIEAAAARHTKGKLARKLAAGLNRMRSRPDRLLLLRVDDFGTTGLLGDETGTGNFAALVRNNLDTHKINTSAGGSFGLGKAAHWRCSDVSTVFFNTVTDAHAARVIARSELTFHTIDDGTEHAGPGWFGVRKGNLYVESADDAGLARRLHLERDPLPPELNARVATPCGTSILVVAFQNPASEDPDDPVGLVDEIEREIAVNFWPAIMKERLAAIVEHQVNGHVRQTRIVEPRRFVPELCAIYEKFLTKTAVDAFENPGDVVCVPVPIRLPRCTVDREDVLKHNAIDGEAMLLVGLADNDEPSESGSRRTSASAAASSRLGHNHVNQLAMVRKPLMVTQYASKAGIMVGARPFYGVLLAGEAAGSDPANQYIEQFLRASEPPAHDKWFYSDDLREMYDRGAKTRLEEFLGQKVNEALRRILRVPSKSESDGPAELKRLLNLGGGPGGEAKDALAVLRNIQPRFVGDHWEIRADVLVKKQLTKSLTIEPYLALNVESGRPLPVRWAKLELVPAVGVKQRLSVFIAGKNASRFTFKGITEPSDVPVDAARCTARIALKLEESL
jgi:RNA polymerase primary sigma factor